MMRRTALVAFVCALAAGGVASAKMVRRRPVCVSDQKQLDKLRREKAAADAFTAKAYADALAAAKLTPIELQAREAGGLKGAPGDETTIDVRGKKLRVVIAGQAEDVSHLGLEFVEDSSGDLWLVERAARVKSSKYVTQCGCGPPGRGAAPRIVAWAYVLPDGKTYKGKVTVTYDAKVMTLGWTRMRTRNGRDEPCPQPP